MVTWLVIGLCVIVYLWERSLGREIGGSDLRPGIHACVADRPARSARRLHQCSAGGHHLYLNVHARQHSPYRRQHALSVDFREQCRRRDGARAFRGILSCMRRGGGADAGYYRSCVTHTHGRRLGRNFRRACGLRSPVSACAGHGHRSPSASIFYPFALSAFWVVSFWFVPAAAECILQRSPSTGRRLVGSRRWVCRGPRVDARLFKSRAFPLFGRPRPGPWSR